jgi:two-component system LytT family response regulator
MNQHLYKCLIVDDEPIARKIVETYTAQYPVLQVVALCANAIEAKLALQQHEVDILFLDINMPVLDGIGFLKTLRRQPQVIFTTAYKEYAVDAFDLSACDYLLKPFSFERFIVAVDKAVDRLRPATVTPTDTKILLADFVFIKAEGRTYKLPLNDVLYAEANGNYTKIVTGSRQYLPAMTFSALDDLLPENQFIKTHRSFLVNKNKITHLEGNRVFINNYEIPIGSNHRESFLKACGIGL